MDKKCLIWVFRNQNFWNAIVIIIIPKISHAYLTIKLGKVIPYLRKIQKPINHVMRPFCSASISIFSPEISNFCYIKIFHFNTCFLVVLTFIESLMVVLINMVVILIVSANFCLWFQQQNFIMYMWSCKMT